MAKTKTAIERVRAWMDEHGRNQASLAKELGLSEPSVSSWFLGRTRPTAPYRMALQRIAGVESAAWMTDVERKIAQGGDEAA